MAGQRDREMDGQTAEGHVWMSSSHQLCTERERREGMRAPGRPQGGGLKPNPKNSCVHSREGGGGGGGS